MALEGEWIAAVKACGEGAVLSHRSAAALWRIASPSRGPVDVTIPGRSGRERRRGITLHRSGTLLPSQCTLRVGIPVTRPSRTLDDLDRVLSANEFAAALREAEYLRLPIGERFKPDRTRSELERLFLALCDRFRLPVPDVNVRIGLYTADFLWARRRLVVETDGWRAHRGRLAFEEDHARDLELRLRGYEVLRFTYSQVVDEPARVAAALRPRLADERRRDPGA
jgi:very-short-patch-repair endonuclease